MKRQLFLMAFGILMAVMLFGPGTDLVSAEREGAGGGDARIQPGASDVDLTLATTSSTTFAAVPNTIVVAPFSSFSRRCVLRFSAEASSTAGDRLDIRTSVNGGACSVFGPEFFSVNNAALQTRTNQSIVNVGPGAPNFRPCWARGTVVIDAASDSVSLFFRTYTVECSTN